MKKIFQPAHCLFLCFILFHAETYAQETFSIVAVDPVTGEVGSAGATCIDTDDCGGCGGAVIISGLIPGRGAVNSQATVCLPNVNLNSSLNRLLLGDSPQQALNWIIANDQCAAGNSTNRQYGIVDLDPVTGNARAVAYTGANALNYANHIVGDNYAIQGNILLGQAILDSMENRFLASTGSLAEKLMAALQGANVPGADVRCLSEGVSSKSAFIRVARPDDAPDDFWLDLNVPATPFGVEPITALQTLFDDTGLFTSTTEITDSSPTATIYPNPTRGVVYLDLDRRVIGAFSVKISDVNGRVLGHFSLQAGRNTINAPALQTPQVVLLSIENERGEIVQVERLVLMN